MKSYFVILFSVVVFSCSPPNESGFGNRKPYNVILIIVDDEDAAMNSIQHQQIKTPAFERLAKNGTLFLNAHCAVPACAPSRTAMLTGVAAHHTGAYYNNHNLWKTASKYTSIDNLGAHFKKQGYLTASFGKVFHPGHDTYNKDDWTDGYYIPYSVKENNGLKDFVTNRIKVFSDMWSIGTLPDDWDQDDTTKMQQDSRNVLRTIDILKGDHDKPFFVTLGIYKPHVPYYVPERFFDMYPLDSIQIPKGYVEDDLNDVPECAQWVATRRHFHQDITERGLWKTVIQAKMASITYADEQMGRVLDALESSSYNDNTIVVFVGDNGFHTGQKKHWSKFALWEKATRVPMAIAIPGETNGRSVSTPISTLDIYPTLVDLCGLENPATHNLDGFSLRNMLQDPAKKRPAPVISTHGSNNHVVITDQYSLISYRNGEEELYDNLSDPYQIENLAVGSQLDAIRKELRQYLPKENVDNLPFDYGDESSKGWDPKVFNVQ